jgi:hypothetical protein
MKHHLDALVFSKAGCGFKFFIVFFGRQFVRVLTGNIDRISMFIFSASCKYCLSVTGCH